VPGVKSLTVRIAAFIGAVAILIVLSAATWLFIGVAVALFTEVESPPSPDESVRGKAGIQGRVVYSDENPAGGLWVRLTSNQPDESWEYISDDIRIAADGSFAIHRLPAGWYDLEVGRRSVNADRIPDGSWQQHCSVLLVRSDLLLGEETRELGDLCILEQGVIDGVLLDANGMPLSDVNIVPTFDLPNETRSDIPATTNAEGGFRFCDVMPGRVWLTPELPEGMRCTHRFGLDIGSGERVTCTLDFSTPLHTLALRFVEVDGTPFVTSRVQAWGPYTEQPMLEWATDTEGHVTVDALEPGPVEVWFWDSGVQAGCNFSIDPARANGDVPEIIAPRGVVEVTLDARMQHSWSYEIEGVELALVQGPGIRNLPAFWSETLEPGDTFVERRMPSGRYRLLACETRRRLELHAPEDYDKLQDEPWVSIQPFTVPDSADPVRLTIED